jgi:hypothetical protein
MTSEIKGSTLRVRGLLKTLKLSLDYTFQIGPPHDPPRGDFVLSEYPVGSRISFDTHGGDEINYEDALKFLPTQSVEGLLLTYRGLAGPFVLRFLLLEHVSGAEGYHVYRRIGTGTLWQLSGEKDVLLLFDGVKPTTLELV